MKKRRRKANRFETTVTIFAYAFGAILLITALACLIMIPTILGDLVASVAR